MSRNTNCRNTETPHLLFHVVLPVVSYRLPFALFRVDPPKRQRVFARLISELVFGLAQCRDSVHHLRDASAIGCRCQIARSCPTLLSVHDEGAVLLISTSRCSCELAHEVIPRPFAAAHAFQHPWVRGAVSKSHPLSEAIIATNVMHMHSTGQLCFISDLKSIAFCSLSVAHRRGPHSGFILLELTFEKHACCF